MKLTRLQSIANNAVRDSIWTPEPMGLDPFYTWKPTEVIIVDLLRGTLSPDMKGDNVEKYYNTMSRWFHDVLKKEGIPIELIERATITISPGKGKRCVIIAQGRTFESTV